MRHGQTDYNLKGIVQGRGIDSELNQTGKNQAKKFFQFYKNLPLDAIYTSTLKRTKQTVAPFLDLDLSHKELIGLDELDWGVFEGMETTPEIHEQYKFFLKSWREGKYHVGPLKGESPEVVSKRQELAIKQILEQTHEKLVLLCMHGRAMRILLCQLLQNPLSMMDQYEHTNTCLYLLKQVDSNFEIVERNNIVHLSN